MPRTWSPEQRKELGDRIRAAHQARKAKLAEPELEEVELNPIATDVVEAAAPRPHRKVLPSKAPAFTKPQFSATALIHDLEAIPLDVISYADCGLLLNALSAASTGVALARRQRQEQLEAGTQRGTCKTCGRTIDISKSGGFQILTERDEFHMPVNSYYCSQNCLLARNMPSHARQTSREKRENRA